MKIVLGFWFLYNSFIKRQDLILRILEFFYSLLNYLFCYEWCYNLAPFASFCRCKTCNIFRFIIRLQSIKIFILIQISLLIKIIPKLLIIHHKIIIHVFFRKLKAHAKDITNQSLRHLDFFSCLLQSLIFSLFTNIKIDFNQFGPLKL